MTFKIIKKIFEKEISKFSTHKIFILNCLDIIQTKNLFQINSRINSCTKSVQLKKLNIINVQL
jgi:hypothetical protein